MKLWLAIFATSLSFPLSATQGMAVQAEKDLPSATVKSGAAAAAAAVKAQQAEEPETDQPVPGGIRFHGAEWTQVISHYAEQAGLSLQNVERWPAGTFNLKDDNDYTPIDALDELNRSLAGLKEPFTLIRNRSLLLLKPMNQAISDQLIDQVKPEDLNQRGKFELMRVMFDLGEIDNDLIGDLKKLVSDQHIKHFHEFKASNQILVRETGGRLRNIRDVIEKAKKELAAQKPGLLPYQLKFQDVDTFIALMGPQLGIPEGKVSNKENTISIIAAPLANRLFVSGTREMLDRFLEIAETIDSDPNDQLEAVDVERPYLQTYSITIDPKLAYDLLGTMLEGSGAIMQQDELSGAITVRGRKEDHAIVTESLASVTDAKTKNFAIIEMKAMPVTDALGVLQQIYRQSTGLLDEAPAKGPVMLANTFLNQIIVSGTAQEVVEVRKIAEELDARYVPAETGPRTNSRMILMSPEDQKRLAPALGDLLRAEGRDNPFNVIRPEQRKGLDDRLRNGEPIEIRSNEERMEDALRDLPSKDDGVRYRRPTGRRRGASLQKKPASFLRQASALAFLALGAEKANLVSNMMLLQQVDETQASNDDDGMGYRAPEGKKSVAGAPIEFRFTEYGLMIESDDLDAADDIEAAIAGFLGESSEVQLPSFFQLQHRGAAEMKQMLESILGLSDSSGAGGGGEGGNPLTGMMSNMMPGADLFDGLLGGGGGSGGISGLEGDVIFGTDVRFNELWVTGATTNDLSLINNLIDYWDHAEGETTPELLGKTRSIKVYHSDVLEVLDMIRTSHPDMIHNEQAAKQNGQGGGGEAAQMLKAAQQLMGGKGGGGGGSVDAGAKPTVVLTADTANSQILVKGPQHIYDELVNFVNLIDVPSSPKVVEVLPGVPDFVLDAVMEKYGGMLKLAGEEEAAPASPGTSAGQGNQAQNATQNQARQQLQSAIRNAARQQQGNNGGGGGGRGGGGAGGGRGGGGGGGGGRGGGGGGGRGGR